MSAAAHPLRGRRILVVEDEYLIAMEVKNWLQTVGSKVVGPVPSVEQALDLIEDGGLEAAVLDINLGEGDTAYAIADELGERGIPYLFATGDAQMPRAAAYNQRPRLEKPYLKTELMLALTKLFN